MNHLRPQIGAAGGNHIVLQPRWLEGHRRYGYVRRKAVPRPISPAETAPPIVAPVAATCPVVELYAKGGLIVKLASTT